MAMLLSACSDDDKKETILSPDELFSATTITFDGLAGEQTNTVVFNAPAPWTAEIHSIGSWLKADVLHGEAGESRIVLSPRSDNFGVTAREALLEIYIDGYEGYSITVNQKSAATGDVQVNGHISDGVMTLTANETGTEFCDTLWITSSKRWSLAMDSDGSNVLSFETDGDSRNGEETNVMVVVKAAYGKFASTSYEGKFYIKTDDGSAVPITVKANAVANVYDHEFASQNESERVSFAFVDTVMANTFMTDFYVESNVRWTIGEMPSWVESGAEASMITNVLSSGKVNPRRQHVSFRVKANELSRDGKSGALTIVDARGEVLKTVYLTFAGVGSNYIASALSVPGEDPNGNPWGFEAKAEYIDASNPADYWKEVRHKFNITTSVDFTTIENAPFHLLLVRADNGIAMKQEMHWAHLEMGNGNSSYNGGLYTRELVLAVSDRGDADDQNGITSPTDWRRALVCIVPVSVSFNDLWTADGKMKEAYSDNAILISQKNDAHATYTFGFEEVANEGTVTVPSAGGALTMNIAKGSYPQCDIVVQSQNAEGEWVSVGSDVCRIDFTTDDNGNPKTMTFTLSKNKGEKNPFTGVVVGSARHLRVSVSAFLGDAEGSKTIFTFYIDQDLE